MLVAQSRSALPTRKAVQRAIGRGESIFAPLGVAGWQTAAPRSLDGQRHHTEPETFCCLFLTRCSPSMGAAAGSDGGSDSDSDAVLGTTLRTSLRITLRLRLRLRARLG